jgi:hypothetical protein
VSSSVVDFRGSLVSPSVAFPSFGKVCCSSFLFLFDPWFLLVFSASVCWFCFIMFDLFIVVLFCSNFLLLFCFCTVSLVSGEIVLFVLFVFVLLSSVVSLYFVFLFLCVSLCLCVCIGS